jgi:hypothetical protein
VVDKIFLALYGAEMLIKIVAMGFYYGKFAYLSDGWNKLDFFIVCCG